MALDERLFCPFDQVSKLHAAGAGRFTAATLDARVEGPHYLVRWQGVLLLYFSHEPNPAPGGQSFVARHSIGGTLGQAEAALYACNKFVGIELEIHRSYRPPGTRPGLRRPLGSKRAFARAATFAEDADAITGRGAGNVA